MRILLFSDTFAEDSATAPMFQLCRRLSTIRQLTISVWAAGGEDGSLQERLRTLGINTRYLGCDCGHLERCLRVEGRRLRSGRERPDLLHFFGGWPSVTLAAIRGKDSRLPVVHTPTHPIHHPWWRRLKARFAAPGPDHFVATSRAWESCLLASRIPRERLHLIPTGIDTVDCFPQAGPGRARTRLLLAVGPDTPVVTTVGDPDCPRRTLGLLEGFARVLEVLPEARLFLIGEGAGAAAAREWLAAHPGRAASIRCIGPLAEMRARVAGAADAVVYVASSGHPSAWQAAEAAAAGAVLLAPKDPYIADFLKPGENGLALDPADPAAVDAALRQVFTEPEAADAMRLAARDTIVESLELSQMAERYVALWRQLAPEAPWDHTQEIPADLLDEMARPPTP